MVIDASLSLCPVQLNSNVVSLNSHVGQYAVICEKQREEVWRQAPDRECLGWNIDMLVELLTSILNIVCCFVHSKILKLKQKLKEYEERKSQNSGPGGSELTWSRKQAEFKQ